MIFLCCCLVVGSVVLSFIVGVLWSATFWWYLTACGVLVCFSMCYILVFLFCLFVRVECHIGIIEPCLVTVLLLFLMEFSTCIFVCCLLWRKVCLLLFVSVLVFFLLLFSCDFSCLCFCVSFVVVSLCCVLCERYDYFVLDFSTFLVSSVWFCFVVRVILFVCCVCVVCWVLWVHIFRRLSTFYMNCFKNWLCDWVGLVFFLLDFCFQWFWICACEWLWCLCFGCCLCLCCLLFCCNGNLLWWDFFVCVWNVLGCCSIFRFVI